MLITIPFGGKDPLASLASVLLEGLCKGAPTPRSPSPPPPWCFSHKGILGVSPDPRLREVHLQTLTSQTSDFSSEAKLATPTIANTAAPKKPALPPEQL